MARMYSVHLMVGTPDAGEADHTAEFYGSVRYRVNGVGNWIVVAETSDNNPWVVPEQRTASSLGFISIKMMYLKLDESAKTLQFQTSIKEYDPSVFDADEDLGSITFDVPLPTIEQKSTFGFLFYPDTGGRFRQGTSATGIAEWSLCISRGGEA